MRGNKEKVDCITNIDGAISIVLTNIYNIVDK